MLIRDSSNPVLIVYRFPAPFPIRLRCDPDPDIELDLVADGYGWAELRLKHGLHSAVLRKWSSVEQATFCCETGVEFDYTPGPNCLRLLARAGLAAVVIGPFCRLRYTDPSVSERGFWPVPPWTGSGAPLYDGARPA